MAVKKAASWGSQLRQAWDRVGWDDTSGNPQLMMNKESLRHQEGWSGVSLKSRDVLHQGHGSRVPPLIMVTRSSIMEEGRKIGEDIVHHDEACM